MKFSKFVLCEILLLCYTAIDVIMGEVCPCEKSYNFFNIKWRAKNEYYFTGESKNSSFAR